MKKILIVLFMLTCVTVQAKDKPRKDQDAKPGLFRTVVCDAKAVGKTTVRAAVTVAKQAKRIFY